MKTSAGLLLYKFSQNPSPESLKLLLVHPGGPYNARRDLGAWSIPKGLVEATETANMLQTAIREVKEELGADLSTESTENFIYLGEIKQKNSKKVHGWAIEHELPDEFVPPSNTRQIEWPPKTATYIDIPEVDRAQYFDVVIAKEKIIKEQIPFIDALLTHLL